MASTIDSRFLARDNNLNCNIESRFRPKTLPNRKPQRPQSTLNFNQYKAELIQAPHIMKKGKINSSLNSQNSSLRQQLQYPHQSSSTSSTESFPLKQIKKSIQKNTKFSPESQVSQTIQFYFEQKSQNFDQDSIEDLNYQRQMQEAQRLANKAEMIAKKAREQSQLRRKKSLSNNNNYNNNNHKRPISTVSRIKPPPVQNASSPLSQSFLINNQQKLDDELRRKKSRIQEEQKKLEAIKQNRHEEELIIKKELNMKEQMEFDNLKKAQEDQRRKQEQRQRQRQKIIVEKLEREKKFEEEKSKMKSLKHQEPSIKKDEKNDIMELSNRDSIMLTKSKSQSNNKEKRISKRQEDDALKYKFETQARNKRLPPPPQIAQIAPVVPPVIKQRMSTCSVVEAKRPTKDNDKDWEDIEEEEIKEDTTMIITNAPIDDNKPKKSLFNVLGNAMKRSESMKKINKQPIDNSTPSNNPQNNPTPKKSKFSMRKSFHFNKSNKSNNDPFNDEDFKDLESCVVNESSSPSSKIVDNHSIDDNVFTFQNHEKATIPVSPDYTYDDFKRDSEYSDKAKPLKKTNINIDNKLQRKRVSMISQNLATPETPFIEGFDYLKNFIELNNDHSGTISLPSLDSFSSNDDLFTTPKKNQIDSGYNSPITQYSNSLKSAMKKKGNAHQQNTVKFANKVHVSKTWSKSSYDRQSDNTNTCSFLTPQLIEDIKLELNSYKKDMAVHQQSNQYTHYFQI